MKAVTVPSPYGASSSSCHHYNNYRVVILMAKSKKSQPASSPNKIKNILAPTAVDSKKEWKNCKLDLKKCSATQLQTVQNYRTQFLKAVNIGLGTSSRGLWINSCYAHCQSGSVSTWLADKSPVVGNAKMGKAVGDWFYDRSAFEKIDCPYPCNPTCVSVDSES